MMVYHHLGLFEKLWQLMVAMGGDMVLCGLFVVLQ